MLVWLATFLGKVAITIGAALVVGGVTTFLLRKIVFWLTLGLGAILILVLATKGVPGIVLGAIAVFVLFYALLARVMAVAASALKMVVGYALILLPFSSGSSAPMVLAPILTALTFVALILAPKALRRIGVSIDASTKVAAARGDARVARAGAEAGQGDASADAGAAPAVGVQAAPSLAAAYCAHCEAWSGDGRQGRCPGCSKPMVRALFVRCPDCEALVEADALHRHRTRAHSYEAPHASISGALQVRLDAPPTSVRLVPTGEGGA